MKRKVLITEILNIIVNCTVLPLYFIKIFHDVAVHPGFDEDGNQIVGRFDHYYSIYYKLDRENLAFILWAAVVISAVSVLSSVLTIVVKDNKILKVASRILFAISVISFLVLLFISLQIRYDY